MSGTNKRQDFSNHNATIKNIQVLCKKKKLAEAKLTFINFMTYMRKDRQCIIGYKPITKDVLKQLDEIYMKLGMTGGSYFTRNSEEWSVICFLGWLQPNIGAKPGS